MDNGWKLKNLAVVTPVFLEAEPVLNSNIFSVQAAKSLRVQTKHMLIQDGVCNLSHFYPPLSLTLLGNLLPRLTTMIMATMSEGLELKKALSCSMDAVTFWMVTMHGNMIISQHLGD